MRATSPVSGKSLQHGRFGGLITTPALGSSGPGEHIPIPRIRFCGPVAATAFSDTVSIVLVTAASPLAGPSLHTMGLRVWHRISPLGSTRPAATFVPPMSTPITSPSRTAREAIASAFHGVARSECPCVAVAYGCYAFAYLSLFGFEPLTAKKRM